MIKKIYSNNLDRSVWQTKIMKNICKKYINVSSRIFDAIFSSLPNGDRFIFAKEFWIEYANIVLS